MPFWIRSRVGYGWLPVSAALAAWAAGASPALLGQETDRTEIRGVVVDRESGTPLSDVFVGIEGTELAVLTDDLGLYRLTGVPPGRQVLRAQRIGYAAARIPVVVRADESLTRTIELAVSALEMEGIRVTADALGRAEGELGTATVIDEEAIRNQTAVSLQGILDLVPGVELTPPGLEGVQQFSLRSVPAPATFTGFGVDLAGGRSPADLASFGTSIVLDGIPLSNNANLQTLGPRGDFPLLTAAGGGIDIRRIPASTLERVEVIRGVPSVRWGDLTQGAVIVYTKAGAIDPELAFQADPRTLSGAGLGGTRLGGGSTGTFTADLTRTRLAPGLRDDIGSRFAGQAAHRLELGDTGDGSPARFVLDTRLDLFQVLETVPVEPDIDPDRMRRVRDRGLRLSERARLRLGDGHLLRLTGAFSYTQQRFFRTERISPPAMPITDRLSEGRQEGSFIVGNFVSRFELEGEPAQVYLRLEEESPVRLFGFDHTLRPGVILRREWNDGPGFQFEVDRPPQTSFNGVVGFDRPRRWDEIPPMTSSAVYLDDRLTRSLWDDARLEVQAGVRVDLLHEGSTWASEVRDAVFQPRVSAELSPTPAVGLRLGAGRTAKLPSLADLYPAPQWFDVVNVNFFANDPAERLAVLTTFLRDPTNPDLGFSVGEKLEAGIEVGLGPGSGLSLTAFRDRIEGGVGISFDPDFLLRERFALEDTPGDGMPPVLIEPAAAVDTVPILIQRPDNILELENRGLELTASLPELAPIHTRFEVQGAWIETEFRRAGLDFGTASLFTAFQLDEDRPRSPFWDPREGNGEQAIFTYRGIYHQPELGLVITGIVQHFAVERQRIEAATDTLAFAGYITRTGELVRVPPERRGDPEFSDLRRTRTGFLTEPSRVPADWFLSLRVAKTLPLDGRLTFYAFNALDREGKSGGVGFGSRFFTPARFGLEARFPLRGLFR